MKGKISIGGKTYECEVIDGIRYVDGKTIDEFMDTISIEDVMNLAIVGSSAGTKVSPRELLKTIEKNTQN